MPLCLPTTRRTSQAHDNLEVQRRHASGHTGIKDYDLVYFDDHTSWEAEDEVIRRVAAATRGCVGPVEVRNQARVHLWFGRASARLARPSARLMTGCSDGGLDVAAPFGLDDLFGLVIRPNRALDNAATHASKAARAKAVWPEVAVIPW
jgi:uncharacterized protein